MYENTWTAAGSADRESRSFDVDGRLEFTNGPFSGTIARDVIKPGVALYRASGTSSHSWRLTTDGDAPAGHLVLGTMLSGAGALEAEGNSRKDWRGYGRPFAVSLAEREIAYHVEPVRPWRVVSLLLEPHTLDQIASEDGLPSLARSVLDNGRLPIAQVYGANRQVVRVAQQLLSDGYSGAMAALWRETKAIELLIALLDQLHDVDAAQRSVLNARELARVHAAHQVLISDLRKTPSVNSLARQSGLSVRRLNYGFRHLYGMSVFEVLLEERMKLARQMVRDRADLPLKHIAWMVGYSQLSNFIIAYGRRFGTTPGQDRRSGRM